MWGLPVTDRRSERRSGRLLATLEPIMPDRRVTDIEIRFRDVIDPVLFTCDEARGDTMEADGQTRRYLLKPQPGVDEAHIIHLPDVVYMRVTTRPADDLEDARYQGGGASVLGETPTPH